MALGGKRAGKGKVETAIPSLPVIPSNQSEPPIYQEVTPSFLENSGPLNRHESHMKVTFRRGNPAR